jgi:Sporulation and spore germination
VKARHALGIGGLTAVAAALAWALFVGLPRWSAARHAPAPAPPAAAAAPAPDGRKINARLFFVADGGLTLTSVEQEVPFGEGTSEQAKAIVVAQISPVEEPLVSAIPLGTVLRALFVTPEGEAYVDFSRELVAAHPGGSTNELLTVHTIVEALTGNLPGIKAVQILVDGKEIDTLAGHLDLRRPLTSDARLRE